MREVVTEKWLGQKIKAQGGAWLKFVSPGHTGVPDRIMILRGHVVFVEMKTETEQLSKIQKATFVEMNKCGVSVHVVYGKPGAEKFLTDLKSPAGFVLGGGLEDVYEWR